MDITIKITNNLSIPAFLSAPEKKGKYPAIILIHEIWGLNEHMKDVVNRFHKENYTVLAPDLLSGTALEGKFNESVVASLRQSKSREEAAKIMAPILSIINSSEFKKNTVKKLQTCFAYLKNQGILKIAVVGFCFGGTYSFALAAEEPSLSACVPFYGHPPESPDKVKNINCPILAFYGEQDTQLMESLPKLKETMKKYNKQFEAITYLNCGHAFFNDANPATYNKEAARDAWNKTTSFLSKYLKRNF